MATYNPFTDFNPAFTQYKYLEPEVTKIEDPLFGINDLPEGYRLSSTGNYIAPANTPEAEAFDSSYLDENAQTHYEQNTSINPEQLYISGKTTSLKGSENLSKIIDEVSNEKGFEKLKDSHIKNLILLQAKRESSFNPSAKSTSSSASGYFQFIDSTRKRYSSYSKTDFLKDQKEQVRAAYKYFMDIHNSPSAIKLKEKGYNDALITALGWWYPKSMDMVLQGKRNFSLGGYSIKKAFQDYG